MSLSHFSRKRIIPGLQRKKNKDTQNFLKMNQNIEPGIDSLFTLLHS